MASQVESIKWVPGTPFIVDGFRFASDKTRHYFLTHAHSDHTIGLTRNFSKGTVYASPITAELLIKDFRLRPDVVQVLEVGERVVIEGVGVTPLCANHCPGAVMFLFEVPKGCDAQGMQATQLILHTGDCRWRNEVMMNPQGPLACLLAARQVQCHAGGAVQPNGLDILMLDTTYCKPRHNHPPQEVAIAAMVECMRSALQQEPATLFVFGAYHIGKERAYLGAAEALGLKVHVPLAKRKVLSLLGLPQKQLDCLLGPREDPTLAAIHVVSGSMTKETLEAKLEEGRGAWRGVVGIRATGWVYSKSKGAAHLWRINPRVSMLSVAYSEHSSWSELCAAVSATRPCRLVPTVDAPDRAAASAIVDRFAQFMDLSNDRNRLDYWLATAQPAQRTCGPQQDQEVGGGSGATGHADAGWCGWLTCAANRQQTQTTVGPSVCSVMDGGLELNSGLCLGTDSADTKATQPEPAARMPRVLSSSLSGPSCSEAQEGVTRLGDAPATVLLSEVDLQEQQRIWEELQRVKRLRCTLEARRQARAPRIRSTRSNRARSNG